MRQILMNMSGAVIARMPRPVVRDGTVLVRVRYSVVSVGTEIAPLRPAKISAPDTTAVERQVERVKLLRHYFKASLRDPRKAARRLAQIAERRLSRRRMVAPTPVDGDAATPPIASDTYAQGWNVGYSAAGEVIEIGAGITDLARGDLVACAGANEANHADYIVVHRNLVCRIPDGCDLASAASTTIGAIALQGVRRTAPELGDRVAVLGLGLIGQITAQLLRAAGCQVIGLDLDPARVDRARALGLDAGASDVETFTRLVRDTTRGRGVDRTVMTAATKSSSVINLAMEITRAKGRVVIVGDVGLNVERAVFYRKEIDLLMSTSYGPGRYDPAYEVEGHDYPFGYVRWTENRNMQAYMEMIASGRLRVAPLYDRTLTIEEAPAVYDQLAKAEESLPLGVLIAYDEPGDRAEAIDATRVVLAGHRKAPEGRLSYALVGAGSFGTAMLVPQMQKRKDRFFLKAIVTRSGTGGSNFARDNQVEILTSDYGDVLADPAIDLVVVATRHHEHAGQVVRAIEAGKHVFVEKPLAISWDELEQVDSAYRTAAAPPRLMVGFNRRFSPALQVVRERTAARRAPLMIDYRLNAGYIALDHWVHGTMGGGRNIGEACHMYDVFRFLAGAPVVSVSATAIDPGDLPYARNDNFAATIAYADGSVATLTYTALGPKTGLGKEFITIFSDGDAYLVDDFRRLTRASDGSTLWQSGEADKGHFEELSRFGDAIATGAAAPIPFDELIETTAVSLEVEDQLIGREL